MGWWLEPESPNIGGNSTHAQWMLVLGSSRELIAPQTHCCKPASFVPYRKDAHKREPPIFRKVIEAGLLCRRTCCSAHLDVRQAVYTGASCLLGSIGRLVRQLERPQVWQDPCTVGAAELLTSGARLCRRKAGKANSGPRCFVPGVGLCAWTRCVFGVQNPSKAQAEARLTFCARWVVVGWKWRCNVLLCRSFILNQCLSQLQFSLVHASTPSGVFRLLPSMLRIAFCSSAFTRQFFIMPP